MPKLKPGTIRNMPEEDVVITAAAMSDPDAAPFTDKEWEAAKSMAQRGRGRPIGSGTKEQITVRFDTEVIEAFKAEGNGWQTRMNEALKDWLRTHRS